MDGKKHCRLRSGPQLFRTCAPELRRLKFIYLQLPRREAAFSSFHTRLTFGRELLSPFCGRGIRRESCCLPSRACKEGHAGEGGLRGPPQPAASPVPAAPRPLAAARARHAPPAPRTPRACAAPALARAPGPVAAASRPRAPDSAGNWLLAEGVAGSKAAGEAGEAPGR